MGNYIADFRNEENIPRREVADPRVIRRYRIGMPNAMASVASDEAFLLMECIKKCAVQERA